MSQPHTQGLVSFLEAARRRDFVDLEAFGRLVLVGPAVRGLHFDSQSAADAVRVLERAFELNPDESVSLRWFTTQALPPFGMKTPAELTIAGKAEAVLEYIDSVASGFSG